MRARHIVFARDAVNGVVIGLLLVIVNLSLAALVFKGALVEFLPVGVGATMVGGCVIGVVSSLMSSYKPVIASPQDTTVVVVAVLATQIAAEARAAGSAASVLPTVIAAVALVSLIVGAVLFALGGLRVGKIVRFIPYPVIGGFLAGIGWMLIDGSIGLMAGVSLSPTKLGALFHPDTLKLWLPGVGFGISLLVITRRYQHFLVFPGLLVVGIVAFYGWVGLSTMSVSDVSRAGLLLGPFESGAPWPPIGLSDFRNIEWSVFPAHLGNIGVIVTITATDILLYVSALEFATGKELDPDRELRVAGIANLLSGAVAGPVGYLSLSISKFGHDSRAETRVIGLVSAGVVLLTFLVGVSFFAYLPKVVLGGLLCFLGMSFLYEQLYHSAERLPRGDYFLVILILIAVAVFGVLEGVILGLVISSILFAANYSRTQVVRNAATGKMLRSKASRTTGEEEVFRTHGARIQILQLQGYIFFGTAYNLFQRVAKFPTQGVEYVILDFRYTSGLDASAIQAFERIKGAADSTDMKLVFTDMAAPIEARLRRANCIAPPSVSVMADVDRGLEWCESQLLIRHPAPHIDEITLAERLDKFLGDPSLTRKMLEYLERKEVSEDQDVFRAGDEADDLFLIESGELVAWLFGPARATRLRAMGPGSVVGEAGLYSRKPRSATVRASRPTILYRLSTASLDRMTSEAPIAAAALHRFVVEALSARIVQSTGPTEMMFY